MKEYWGWGRPRPWRKEFDLRHAAQYRNKISREVRIPQIQMAMELMAPWRGPISRALEVPSAWLQAPMATP